VEGNWEGLKQMRNQSPISATSATNVAITGKGIIDGNGAGWRQVKKEKLTEGQWKKLLSKWRAPQRGQKNLVPNGIQFQGQ